MHPRAELESLRAQEAFNDSVVAEMLERCDWEQAELVSSGAATWACLTGDQNVVTPDKPVLHELRRNSAALANVWRTTMSDEDQKTVRRITEPVAGQWHPDW